MNSVGGEADPLQCRVRTLAPEQACLAKRPSSKCDSAGAAQKIAASTGRACTTGTLGMRIGIGRFCKPNVEVRRHRGMRPEYSWFFGPPLCKTPNLAQPMQVMTRVSLFADTTEFFEELFLMTLKVVLQETFCKASINIMERNHIFDFLPEIEKSSDVRQFLTKVFAMHLLERCRNSLCNIPPQKLRRFVPNPFHFEATELSIQISSIAAAIKPMCHAPGNGSADQYAEQR